MENKALGILLNEANSAAAKYAKAYNERQLNKKALKNLKQSAIDALNLYNKTLEKATYREWAENGNAVEQAIRTLVIPGAMRFSFPTDDDDYMTIKVNAMEYPVNLPMMQAVIGADAFHDKDWFGKCEKLCHLVSENICERLNTGRAFGGNISDYAKGFKFDCADPLSDKGIIQALSQVFDAILFIPDKEKPEVNVIRPTASKDSRKGVYSAEWTYIRESMTKNAGTGIVNLCNTGKFTTYVMHAMHTALLRENFALEHEDFVMPRDEDETVTETVEGETQA